jgi:hypothetical protein
MTLIVSRIDPLGIVQAADSNLTYDDGTHARQGQKVFRVGFAPAALSFAGAYVVGAESMDTWMTEAIDNYGRITGPTVAGLAQRLAERLTAEMTPNQKSGPNLIHLAGYVEEAAVSHAVLYFIRNTLGIAPTGEYTDIVDHFDVSEDYWSRHRDHLEMTQLYFNGYPEGRISYLRVVQHMGPMLGELWNNPATIFRPPRTLEEAEQIVKLEMQTIKVLFLVSDDPGPVIGGDIQTELIRPPSP